MSFLLDAKFFNEPFIFLKWFIFRHRVLSELAEYKPEHSNIKTKINDNNK